MTDAQIAIERIESLVPVLDPQLRAYLERVLKEARYMQVVRELIADNIDIGE